MSVARFAVLWGALAAMLVAQGAASCGFHLDIVAGDTSTYSAIGDVTQAPGILNGLPAGAPGNPFTAYASPGSSFKLVTSVPRGALGSAPFGPGTLITVLWAANAVNTQIFPAVGYGSCVGGNPWTIAVLPLGGVLTDGIGTFSFGAAPTGASDPGWPQRFEMTLNYPALPAPVPAVTLQAVMIDPGGTLALSNGVSILPGPSPHETSLLPSLVACGAIAAADEGYAPVATPSGFAFYGQPVGTAHVNTNGFVDFSPSPPGCDFSGSAGDLGCAPATATASPRVAANHFDADYTVSPPGLVSDITVEAVPANGQTPSRTIIRWKNAVPFGTTLGLGDVDHATTVCELWGNDGTGGASRIVVVRQDIHSFTSLLASNMIGIGPGPAGPLGPPGSCTPVSLSTLFDAPALSLAPGDAAFQDNTGDSAMLRNLAVVFDPSGGGYDIRVF